MKMLKIVIALIGLTLVSMQSSAAVSCKATSMDSNFKERELELIPGPYDNAINSSFTYDGDAMISIEITAWIAGAGATAGRMF